MALKWGISWWAGIYYTIDVCEYMCEPTHLLYIIKALFALNAFAPLTILQRRRNLQSCIVKRPECELLHPFWTWQPLPPSLKHPFTPLIGLPMTQRECIQPFIDSSIKVSQPLGASFWSYNDHDAMDCWWVVGGSLMWWTVWLRKGVTYIATFYIHVYVYRVQTSDK